MSSGAANFKLQVSLKRAVDDGPVFQKQDGGRFDSSVTVKLNAGTKYSVVVTARPAKSIRRILLKGDKLELECQKPDRNEDNCCVYHADWTTDTCEVSKASLRTYLPLVIEMEDGASLQTKFQIKVYPATETTHCRWGQEFHMLDLDCTQKPGMLAIDIGKEQYI